MAVDDGDAAFEEHPLLHEPDLMLAVLRAAAARGEASVADGVALLRGYLRTAGEDPPVGDDEIARRLEAARDRLAAAGLVEAAGGGRFRLTAPGRRVLDENPGGVDGTVIARYAGPGAALAAAATAERGAASAAEALPGGDVPAAPWREPEYEEGMAAFRDGRDIGDNPHPLQTDRHRAWADGWSRARDGEMGPLGG